MGAAQGVPLRGAGSVAAGGAAAPDGGAQPSALRRADPGRGPAAGLRLAAAQSAAKDECWHSLVRRGFEALDAEREAFGFGTASAAAAVAADPRRRRRCGARADAGRSACPRGSAPRRTGSLRRRRRSRHGRCRWRPAGRRGWNLGPVPAGRVAAGGAGCRRQPVPPRAVDPRAVAASAGPAEPDSAGGGAAVPATSRGRPADGGRRGGRATRCWR